MTVTYTHKVANARLGGFSSLLVRWKGSVYKLFYKEFLIYISLYTILSIIYRFVLVGESKEYFEKLCRQFNHYTDLVPISFVLGFYVTIVVGRWWSQFENLPFPDRIMMVLGANVHGTDDRGRLIRRTLLRYLSLAEVLTYRCVSTAVYKRFPTMQHVVKAGIMTPNEYAQYENVKSVNLKYWVPLMWFSNLLSKVRQEGRIFDDMTFNLLLQELMAFRANCGWVVGYDWISVPLVYTQVVTVAVYMFFMSTLLSRQYLDVDLEYPGHEVDLYVPIFTIGQFFFYMGWLKVAEQLINPFGEDDDDFEVNWCIDRNVEVTMMVADQMYAKHPKLEKDKFWNMEKPDIPYTAAAANHKVEPYMGSTFDMRVDKDDQYVRDFNSSARLTTLSEHSNEILDQKNFQSPNAEEIRSNKAPSLRFSTLSLGRDAWSPYRLSEKTRLLDSKQDETSSSQSENDEESLLSSSRLQLGLDGSKIVKHADDDESMASDTAADVDDEAADDGGDEKENDDDDKDVSGVLHVLEESARLIVPEVERLRQMKTSDNVAGTSRQTINRVKKSPQKHFFDASSVGPSYKHASIKQFVRNQARGPYRNEIDEERRNAEKRTQMTSGRKKRTRSTLPSRRRRPYKADHLPRLWIQNRFNHESSCMLTPEAASLYSETDAGSGQNVDSPFGSILSCSTSIPSPRPLRWAFKSKRRNIYGDNASIASSMPSPSGNEGETTDAFTPTLARSPGFLEVGFEKKAPESGKAPDLLAPPPLKGAVEVAMPFTDDLRRRLQIIPSANPSPSIVTSAARRDSQHPSQIAFNGRDDAHLLMINHSAGSKQQTAARTGISLTPQRIKNSTLAKSRKQSTVSLGGTLPGFSRTKRRKTIDANEKLSMVVRDCNNNRQEVSFSQTPSAPGAKMLRSGSSLWNTLKTWNAKRKETKLKQKQQAAFRMIQSDGDVMQWFQDQDEILDLARIERDSQISVEATHSSIMSSDDSGLVLNCDTSQRERSIGHGPSIYVGIAKTSPARTISDSEEGRGDVLSDPLNSGAKVTGEIVWENECDTDTPHGRSPTVNQRRKEQLLSLSVNADLSSSALEKSCHKATNNKETSFSAEDFLLKNDDTLLLSNEIYHNSIQATKLDVKATTVLDSTSLASHNLVSAAPAAESLSKDLPHSTVASAAQQENTFSESTSESEAEITVIEAAPLKSELDDTDLLLRDGDASVDDESDASSFVDRQSSKFTDRRSAPHTCSSMYGLAMIPEITSDEKSLDVMPPHEETTVPDAGTTNPIISAAPSLPEGDFYNCPT